MEKNRRVRPLSNAEETYIPPIVINEKMENLSSNESLRTLTNGSLWAAESVDYFSSSSFSNMYANDSDIYVNLSTSTAGLEKKISCQWETAQHSLFQFSNMCFLSAFVIPRNYRCGILFFRILMFISFVVTTVWAGVHFCALDWFIWSSCLAVTNGIHVIVLTFKFLPPALSLELTELYIRLFKPLKVSKKHFKELTKEACLLRLALGETYAVEEVTPTDERLSVLLKGKLKVSCNNMFLHSISSYQFIDSPEWQANAELSETRFQVTITAEEDSVYLTWCRIKLDRILRHRPQVQFVLKSLIGKDITHKMYSLNEQVGHMCTNKALSRAIRDDHWRRAMNRSVSVDEVDTGTRGHVRSTAWKQEEKHRKCSTHSESESPLLGQQSYWYPLVASSQFPAEYPFLNQNENFASQYDEDEQMLGRQAQKVQLETDFTMLQQMQQQKLHQLIGSQYSKLDSNLQPLPILNVTNNPLLSPRHSVALIPIIVPVIATAVNTNMTITSTTSGAPSSSSSRTTSLRRQRGVKFDETRL